MQVFAVHNSNGLVGVFTDKETARKVALLSFGQYHETELDYIPPGIKAAAPEYSIEI